MWRVSNNRLKERIKACLLVLEVNPNQKCRLTVLPHQSDGCVGEGKVDASRDEISPSRQARGAGPRYWWVARVLAGWMGSKPSILRRDGSQVENRRLHGRHAVVSVFGRAVVA